MLMAVNLPVSAFRGVAIRIIAPDQEQPGAVAVILEHHDPSLSLPLFQAANGEDVVIEWQTWARVLALPLLVAELRWRIARALSETWRVAYRGSHRRRRRHNTIRRRRPFIQFRRKPGPSGATAPIYRGEREIIARN